MLGANLARLLPLLLRDLAGAEQEPRRRLDRLVHRAGGGKGGGGQKLSSETGLAT